MKLAVCGLFLLVATISEANLERYSLLVVADANPTATVPPGAIRVTYLGVNGFQFETNGHALLVDPYFTRVGLWSAALNERIESAPNRVSEGLKHVSPHVDAVLVTHAHFDHLLDVPAIMQRTSARLLAGPTAIQLVESLGTPPRRCEIVRSGGVRKIGPWTIRVFAAQHDRLFGKVPFAKCTTEVPSLQSSQRSSQSRSRGSREATDEREMTKSPVKVSDWCVGEPLAFVIESADKRIYVDSGGVPGVPPESRIRDVDLAILGVALPDSRQRFSEAANHLRPRYTLPSHQDDMFAPLDRGFVFGKMTNFPALVRESESKHLPGQLILLDYFRPWTLH